MAFEGQASYYNKNQHSPALIRARKPYMVKNAAVGAGIFVVAATVYYYTIKAVGQDNFEDVKVPETPAKK